MQTVSKYYVIFMTEGVRKPNLIVSHVFFQLLEPIKDKRKDILEYQSDLTTKILELNDLAAKVILP